MGCCLNLSKLFLVIFNILLFLAGLIPLIFGIIALVSEDVLTKVISFIPEVEKITQVVDLTELIKNFAIVFLVLGAVVTVIGFLGCCGVCCTSKFMLGSYLFLLIVILLAEIAIIIVAFVFPDTFNESGQALMKQNFDGARDCKLNGTLECPTDAVALGWNTMQYELKCCGVVRHTDYSDDINGNGTSNGTKWWDPRVETALAPLTCCKHDGKGKLDESVDVTGRCYIDGSNADDYNQQGCFDALIEWTLTSPIFIGVMAGIGALELLLIVATLMNCCKSSKDKRRPV